MNDGIKKKYRDHIIDILSANPRIKAVVLFGSRAMGTYATTSDVDLALYGDELTLDDQSELSEKIHQLTIPQKVELVLYHRIENENLREQIQQHGVEWFQRGDDT